ncbi:GlcNAc-transferase family protein [Roseateles sp.]|jgi:hypothetical protein|uniref:GlcNAc-transferase family protein n=1 Tax=Roseateles sp. TaxID=1971397 RepID=UPI00391A5431
MSPAPLAARSAPAAHSLFISVAAFCEPLLEFTLLNAIAQARHPERLVFGLVEQQWPEHRPALDQQELAPRLRRLQLHPLEARGPCWARALAMSLYQGERWFLQIDAHSCFEPGWDERLIAWGLACQAHNPNFLISAYPNPFRMVEGQAQPEPVTRGVLAHVVKSGCTFAAEHPTLLFESVPVDSEQAVLGLHVAGGCLFGPGHLVQALPYDPFLYFHGEEQAYALRAWTRGWDIFHIPDLPLYHAYLDPQAPPSRPLHWSAELEALRGRTQASAAALQSAAAARLRALLWDGADLGVYGLGQARSLDDYAAFSGIDYRARRIHPGAYKARFGY